jgi:hypothetical protein
MSETVPRENMYKCLNRSHIILYILSILYVSLFGISMDGFEAIPWKRWVGMYFMSWVLIGVSYTAGSTMQRWQLD